MCSALDLYHYLLLPCSNEYFYPVARDYAHLTDTPPYFPFIEPNISPLPQGSLASIPSNALIEQSFWLLVFLHGGRIPIQWLLSCILHLDSRWWLSTHCKTVGKLNWCNLAAFCDLGLEKTCLMRNFGKNNVKEPFKFPTCMIVDWIANLVTILKSSMHGHLQTEVKNIFFTKVSQQFVQNRIRDLWPSRVVGCILARFLSLEDWNPDYTCRQAWKRRFRPNQKRHGKTRL